jgi:hypothetical protein
VCGPCGHIWVPAVAQPFAKCKGLFDLYHKMHCRTALWIMGAFWTFSSGSVESLAGLIPIHLHLEKLVTWASYRVPTRSNLLLVPVLVPVTHIISYMCPICAHTFWRSRNPLLVGFQLILPPLWNASRLTLRSAAQAIVC